jgi:hypothetical protein
LQARLQVGDGFLLLLDQRQPVQRLRAPLLCLRRGRMRKRRSRRRREVKPRSEEEEEEERV